MSHTVRLGRGILLAAFTLLPPAMAFAQHPTAAPTRLQPLSVRFAALVQPEGGCTQASPACTDPGCTDPACHAPPACPGPACGGCQGCDSALLPGVCCFLERVFGAPAAKKPACCPAPSCGDPCGSACGQAACGKPACGRCGGLRARRCYGACKPSCSRRCGKKPVSCQPACGTCPAPACPSRAAPACTDPGCTAPAGDAPTPAASPFEDDDQQPPPLPEAPKEVQAPSLLDTPYRRGAAAWELTPQPERVPAIERLRAAAASIRRTAGEEEATDAEYGAIETSGYEAPAAERPTAPAGTSSRRTAAEVRTSDRAAE